MCLMGTKLRFVLLLLCLPAVLAYPRPAGEEGKEEDRTEGTDDGEIDEEDEEEEEGMTWKTKSSLLQTTLRAHLWSGTGT